jgi:hypothetical protein
LSCPANAQAPATGKPTVAPGKSTLPAGKSTVPPANAQAPATAKSTVAAALIKECTERMKEYPKVQVVGDFFLAKYKTRGVLNSIIDPREQILVVAPTKSITVFGTPARHFSACEYRIQDGKPEFKTMVSGTSLPQRVKLMPGEE